MIYLLLSLLLNPTESSAADSWVCEAHCTRFTTIQYQGRSLQRFYGTRLMTGPAASSSDSALRGLSNLCRRRTPEAFGTSVDLEVYTARLYGIEFIHEKTISATPANSCYRL